MDQVWKEKWLAALRSGDYKQGRLCLVGGFSGKEREYCCLGVLASIQGHNTYMHLGLDDSIQYQLINLNDRDGASFLEIADWIEANL